MHRERIEAKYEEMSPNFRRIADFILQQPLNASFMTATELAKSLGVDAATIVRFAQMLGYTGFRELIKDVQRDVKEEIATAYTSCLDTAEDKMLFCSLLENEKDDLTLTQARLTDQANAILPILAAARYIWVLGQGRCAHLAAFCASTLRELALPAAAIAADPVEAAECLRDVSVKDAVIGFCLAGLDAGVASVIRFARQRGAKTLVFSDSPVAAAALAAEITTVCPSSTNSPIPSLIGLAAMIAALASALAIRYPEKTSTQIADFKRAYNDLMAFQSYSVLKENAAEKCEEE